MDSCIFEYLKKVKSLFIVTLIISFALFVFGLYIIYDEGDYFQGFIMMSLGFTIGINDWFNLFKKKK